MKFKLVLLLFLVATVFNINAQNSINTDSLVNIINNSKDDTLVLKAASELVKHYYFNGDSTATEKLIEQVKPKLSLKDKYAALTITYYGYHTFKACKNTIEGKRLILEAAKIQRELNLYEDEATSYVGLGIWFKRYAIYAEALNYYYKAIEIYTNTDNSQGLGDVNNNIANIFSLIDNQEKAIEYHFKALIYRKQLNKQEYINISYYGLGLAYQRLNNADSAEFYFTKTINECEKINQYDMLAKGYSSLGILYANNNNYKKAEPFYKKALEIRLQQNDEEGAIFSKMNTGAFYLNYTIDPIIITYCTESYNYSKKNGDLFMQRESCHCLYQYFIKTKKFEKAVDYMKEFMSLNDSIISLENKSDIITREMNFEYAKKSAADSVTHEKEKIIDKTKIEKQQLEIKSSRNQKYMLFGGLGLVLLFAFFMFNRYKVMQRQKVVIESQKLMVEEKNKEILDSIAYAKRIQNAILPSNKVVKEYLQESFIYYKPKDIVAGDFYWLETISSRHSALDAESPNEQIAGQARNVGSIVLFAAADCTGHGVPGAMVSVVCNNGLNRSVREYGLTDPGEILNKTREIVVQEFEKSEDEVKDGMDIALCSLQLQATNNKQQTTAATLQYAGANNPLWIIRKQEARDEKEEDNNQQLSTNNYQLIETKANKQPIGKFDNPEPYTTHTIELQKGDSLYIFSDGYADQFGGEKGKKLKTANFKKLLLSIQNESMDKQKELIDEAFEDWKGNLEQLDDVCVIGVRI